MTPDVEKAADTVADLLARGDLPQTREQFVTWLKHAFMQGAIYVRHRDRYPPKLRAVQ